MWRHDWSWEAVTFGIRSPLSIKATDSDEDPLAGAGNSSDEDDLEEVDEDQDEERDEEATGKDDEGAARDEEDESREEKAERRKHRFKDQDSAEEAYAELQGHATRLEQQLAQRRMPEPVRDEREPRGDGDLDEVQMARRIAEAVDEEMSQLPSEKRTLRHTTEAIVKQVLKSVHASTAKVAESHARTVNAQEVARQEAERSAQAALQKIGLDKPVHMRLLHDALAQRSANPTTYRTWVETRTPDEQFSDLARDVASIVRELGGATRKEIQDANRQHRERAAALDSGSRQMRSRREAAEDQNGEKGGDSLLDALQADHESLRKRSGRYFSAMAMARRQ